MKKLVISEFMIVPRKNVEIEKSEGNTVRRQQKWKSKINLIPVFHDKQ